MSPLFKVYPLKHTDLSDHIGKMIRERRKEQGFTLEKLAKAVGVTKGTIQKYESGKIKIPAEKLQRIYDELDFVINIIIVQTKGE